MVTSTYHLVLGSWQANYQTDDPYVAHPLMLESQHSCMCRPPWSLSCHPFTPGPATPRIYRLKVLRSSTKLCSIPTPISTGIFSCAHSISNTVITSRNRLFLNRWFYTAPRSLWGERKKGEIQLYISTQLLEFLVIAGDVGPNGSLWVHAKTSVIS